jgi:hypothetical protein
MMNGTDARRSRIIGPGIDLEVDRLASGRWMLRVNGVEMHFAQRPVFTIPARPAHQLDLGGAVIGLVEQPDGSIRIVP